MSTTQNNRRSAATTRTTCRTENVLTPPTAKSVDRPVVAGAKKQAKRLLKIAKAHPLEIGTLSQAQAVVAQMHGHPHWQAFVHATPEFETRAPEVSGALKSMHHTASAGTGERHKSASVFGAQRRAHHVGSSWGLHAVDDLLHARIDAGVSVLTPDAGLWRHGFSTCHVVEASDVLSFNLFYCPLGTTRMLPDHKRRLAQCIQSAGEQNDPYTAYELTVCFDVLFSLWAPGGAHVVAFDPNEADIVLSSQARDVLNDRNARTWYEASAILMANQMVEDAHRCHARAMPRLTSIPPELVQWAEEGQVDRQNALTLMGTFVGTKNPLDLPCNGVVVFDVNPMADLSLPASTRWMLAMMLANYRNASQDLTAAVQRLHRDMYANPAATIWWTSIDQNRRQEVMDWHVGQPYPTVWPAYILDQMDGPLLADPVGAMVLSIVRDGADGNVGVRLITESKDIGHTELAGIIGISAPA